MHFAAAVTTWDLAPALDGQVGVFVLAFLLMFGLPARRRHNTGTATV